MVSIGEGDGENTYVWADGAPAWYTQRPRKVKGFGEKKKKNLYDEPE